MHIATLVDSSALRYVLDVHSLVGLAFVGVGKKLYSEMFHRHILDHVFGVAICGFLGMTFGIWGIPGTIISHVELLYYSICKVLSPV